MTSRGLILPGAFPVVHDLLAAEDGPFTDELGGASLQASGEHRSSTETEARRPAWYAWKWATG